MRILFLDLDTLRPDHLGCYGYHRNTSPNIDRIAAEGLRFDNYYCSDAPCLPSRAALMTGRFGIHTGIVGHGGTAADMRLEGAPRQFKDRLAAESLPACLRQCGFKTVSISPFAERHSAWWFNAGFNEMHNTGKSGQESAEEVTPTVLKWIGANAREDNWFLHVNYWDAHGYYRAPAEFGNPFKDDPLPDWLTPEVLERQRRETVGPYSPFELNMFESRELPDYPRHVAALRTLDDLHRHLDGYDCGIAYMDGHVGRILAALEAAGVLDDTAIIVSADHGENQGELGIYMEHGCADNITCRIPMIIRWPGMRAGGAVDKGLHLNLDLLPTLADLFGKKPSPRWDGQSYARTLTDGLDSGRPSLVVSQCAHVCQRGVRFGPWLYMRTWHDGFHLFPKEMLFNVETDPHEQRNLASERTDLCREGLAYLNDWHDDMMLTMPAGCAVDPLWTVMREGGPYHARGRLPAYCERLEQTGRSHFAEALRQRHPGEFHRPLTE
jgi:arylsulfatase A-like enzyme